MFSHAHRRPLLSVITTFSLVGFVASGCGTNTVEEESDEEVVEGELLAGRRLSEGEIAALLRQAGFPEGEIPRMVCTAKYESSFYERAWNRNRNGSVDRGLFQINSIHLRRTPGCPTRAEDLFDASINTQCAYGVYSAQGNRAWYGYRAHRYECDRYQLHDDGNNHGGWAAPPSTQSGSCTRLGYEIQHGDCVFYQPQSAWLQCTNSQFLRSSHTSGPAGPCQATYIYP